MDDYDRYYKEYQEKEYSDKYGDFYSVNRINFFEFIVIVFFTVLILYRLSGILRRILILILLRVGLLPGILLILGLIIGVGVILRLSCIVW